MYRPSTSAGGRRLGRRFGEEIREEVWGGLGKKNGGRVGKENEAED